MLKLIKYLLLIPAFFFGYGCSTIPENLSTSKSKVQYYYESGEYEKEVNIIVDETIKNFNNSNMVTNPAVVFDVDETALNNYEIIKAADFGYVKEVWDSWVAQGAAPANKPVKRLYDYFVKREVKIIFLTGRVEDQYNATFKNLINAGYAKFDTLVVLSKEYSKLGSAEFKSDVRKKLTEKGYDIIVTVGDQYPDLNGDYTGLKIKIPNYLYLVE